MATFLDPQQLRNEIKSLFEEAEELLLIVSPYIKLDHYLKRILAARISQPELHIVLLFGKNDDNLGKSLSPEDLRFFQQFPNIEIYYQPNLHAKYYANDNKSIVTSLNLHTYSIAHNVEIGVLFERRLSLFAFGDNREDDRSFAYFMDLIPKTERIFIKSTKTHSSFFGLWQTKGKTRVAIDNTRGIHASAPTGRSTALAVKGYCIRTGVEIPFNLDRPFSVVAFESWSQYGNYDYPEKFCHFSGEKSNGQTSRAKPVLYHHYKKAADLQHRLFG